MDLKVRTTDDFKHLLFSPGGQHDEATLRRAFSEFIDNTFTSQGFECMWELHKDTNNYHFHVILNARSTARDIRNRRSEDGKAYFHPDRADLQAIREEFAYSMTKHGIRRTATLRHDRPHTFEQIRKGVENLKNRKGIYQSKLDNDYSTIDAVNQRASMIKQIDRLLRQRTLASTFSASAFGAFDEKTEKQLKKIDKKIEKHTKGETPIEEVEFKRLQKERNKLLRDMHIKDIEELKTLKKELMKPMTHDEIWRTVEDLKKQEIALKNKIGSQKKVIQTQGFFKTPGQKKDKRDYKTYEKLFEKHKKDIKNAIQAISSDSNIKNKEDKKEAIKVLKDLQSGRFRKR